MISTRAPDGANKGRNGVKLVSCHDKGFSQ